METNWLNALSEDKRPDSSNLIDHILSIHRDNPGFTEEYSSQCIDASGKNTYQWLADVITPSVETDILDLACGSGPLLSHCYERFGDSLSLIGVDISPAELSLARDRLPDSALLVHGKAQNLSFIRDKEIDVVLCHWALTLMDPVVPVLEEVSRVLRPGGTFAAIVDGDKSISKEYEEVSELIYSWVNKNHKNYGKYELGDERIRRKETLMPLLGQFFRQDQITIHENLFSVFGGPDKLAEDVSNFFYASYVLPKKMRLSLVDDLIKYFEKNKQDLKGEFRMPINRMVVRV